ncbi:MAG TPA: hypothetical protein VFB41_07630 [Solirubrobacteraceae bacterium]|nr:hypothetical protein [Solirubrobacteraceae bacterium]
MAQRTTLTERQLEILRWIADGCPTGVMEGERHKISAAALRNRGLVTTNGHGAAWIAKATRRGREYIAEADGPNAPIPRRPNTPTTAWARKPVTVPTDLRGAHPIVRATFAAAAGEKAWDDGRIVIGPAAGVIYSVATRALLRRGLLVVQALLAEAERHGWEISGIDKDYSGRAGAGILIRGHTYRVELHELTETVDFTPAEIEAWRGKAWSFEDRTNKLPPAQDKKRQATGRLGLLLPNGYGGGRVTWNEGPRGALETKLASIIESLAARADADDARAIEAARAAEQRRQTEAARAAHERQRRIENARLERLLAEVQAWRSAQDVRAYISALRADLDEMAYDDRRRVEPWCDWAEEWSSRVDPTSSPGLIRGLSD